VHCLLIFNGDLRNLQLSLLPKMSVLNQCGEEAAECPLCMEHLEVDDLNFFPCTCGYQVNILINIFLFEHISVN